jgi:hypothetical protein
VNEDESLRRYGLRPGESDLDQIREILKTQTALEHRSQGDGDSELMKLCCVQLCGAGLAETKAYLVTGGSESALAALDYLLQCEAAGDFADFSVETRRVWYSEYYLA